MDAREFIAGTVGGCAGVFAGHPFDVVKTRLQSAPKSFVSTTDCLNKTYVREGVKGFFKGILPPIVSNAPISALVFGSYGAALRGIQVVRGDDATTTTTLGEDGGAARAPPNLADVAAAGFIAGGVSSVIVAPTELIKVRLQTAAHARESAHYHATTATPPAAGAKALRGALPPRLPAAATTWAALSPARFFGTGLGLVRETQNCVSQVVKEGGPFNLFRGFNQTLARESLSYACYFASYEAALRAMTPKGKEPSSWAILAAGSLSGILVWGPVYPIDVVKTRIQACKKRYAMSSMQCAQRILKSEGMHGFFRGFMPTMARAVPVNAITFLVFEQVNRCLS